MLCLINMPQLTQIHVTLQNVLIIKNQTRSLHAQKVLVKITCMILRDKNGKKILTKTTRHNKLQLDYLNYLLIFCNNKFEHLATSNSNIEQHAKNQAAKK